MSGFVTPTSPNITDYTTFLQNEGFGAVFLPTNSMWINTTFTVAMGVVSLDLATASPLMYTLAVYNLAADRLINFAQDVQGQNFFRQLREKYNIFSFSPGVIASTSDSGTSSSFANPEALTRLTLGDLQKLKTPYGRAYLSIAQELGPSIWGLT
jgi:hypothetical protein